MKLLLDHEIAHAKKHMNQKFNELRFSTARADRKGVENALNIIYQWMSLDTPKVFWFKSPAALDYIWGLSTGAIPTWFLYKRLNPDLMKFDPRDVPNGFWDGIQEFIKKSDFSYFLESYISLDKALKEKLFEKIKEIITKDIYFSMIFSLSSEEWLNHDEYCYPSTLWDRFVPSGSYAMPKQTLIDTWLNLICILDNFPQPDENYFQLFNSFKTISSNCALWYPFQEAVLLLENPENININQGRLHSDGSPAVIWQDDVRFWFLNGILMPPDIVEKKSSDISAKEILKQKNAEVRREIVRKIGIKRICEELGAECIDSVGNYELLLLNLDLTDDDDLSHYNPELEEFYPDSYRRRPYLKMINPSTGVYHIEGVHPNCTTVQEALTWRNGTDALPVIIT
ncbi:MAG: hypothetical protein HQK79_13825 [Desulfobacterales bacterium]|nr:hypothetical protein [Desulfobacterales bacterium]